MGPGPVRQRLSYALLLGCHLSHQALAIGEPGRNLWVKTMRPSRRLCRCLSIQRGSPVGRVHRLTHLHRRFPFCRHVSRLVETGRESCSAGAPSHCMDESIVRASGAKRKPQKWASVPKYVEVCAGACGVSEGPRMGAMTMRVARSTVVGHALPARGPEGWVAFGVRARLRPLRTGSTAAPSAVPSPART